MRTLSANMVTALESYAARLAYCVRLHDSGYSWDARYTGWDIPIYLDHGSGDVKYSPVPLEFEPEGESFTLTISNVDEGMVAQFLAADRRGNTCDVYLVAIASDHSVSAFDLLFSGDIDGISSLNVSAITLKVVGPLGQWNRYGLRRHYAPCPWAFKGTACGYAGVATECDKSWTTCDSLSNTANFGGEKYLPELMEKKLNWNPGSGR